MSDYQAFQVELKGSIAHVQINRPEKVNAMNAAFCFALPSPKWIVRSF